METIKMIRQLFDYNDWANRKVIKSFNEESNRSPKAIRAFAHLLITEKEYYLRLPNKDSTGFNFWEELSLGDCEALIEENRQVYANLLATLMEADLDTISSYKTGEGVAYENTYREMLTHVIYHSAFHRGQVAMAIRADGGVPAFTDYIAYFR